MPATKLGRMLSPNRDALVALIWGTAKTRGLGAAEFAEKLSMSYTTLRNRKNKPGSFTLDELTRAGKRLGIPMEEILQAAIK